MSGDTGNIIIKGITEDGRRFRPSDWAQRLTTAVGKPMKNRRIAFHPHVHMVTIDGVNCVIIDEALQESEPMLFEFLMDFARSNKLQIERESTV